MDFDASDVVSAAEVCTLPIGVHVSISVRFPVEQVDEHKVAGVEIPVEGLAVVAEFKPHVAFKRNASVTQRRSLDRGDLGVYMRNRFIGHRYLP